MTQSSVAIINHNYNKICDILCFFLIKTQEIPRVSFASSEKKRFKRMRAVVCTVQLYRRDVYCPITLSY